MMHDWLCIMIGVWHRFRCWSQQVYEGAAQYFQCGQSVHQCDRQVNRTAFACHRDGFLSISAAVLTPGQPPRSSLAASSG